MKSTPKTSILDLVSTREALALATLFSVAHVSAAEAPAKEETKDKKKPSESGDLDEITVSAQRGSAYNPQRVQSERFTAPLVNTPQSVTVVPKEVYTQQAATSLNDVLKNTPGITFLAGEGGNPTSGDNQFRMRGFDASNSIFIDGVRDGGQQDRDIFNIEQVEIARGPAGADIGRSTAAGYINLSTKAPKLEQFFLGTTSYAFDESDSDGSFRQTVDYNLALPQLPVEGAAFRFNGLYQEGGIIGRNLAESNRWAIAPSFAIGLGTDTRFIAQLQYGRQNNIPDYGLVRAALDNNDYGGGSYTPALGHVANNTSYGSKYAFEDVESTSATLRFEKDITPDILFTNQLRYSHSDRLLMAVAPTSYQPNPTTGNPPVPNPNYLLVARNFTANSRENDVISNISTLRATVHTGPVEHLLSAGLELIREDTDTTGYASGSIAGADLHNPDHDLRPGAFPRKNGARTGSTLETVSLNLFDTVKLNDQWQITGGLRAEYYDLSYFSRAASGVVTRVDTDDFLVDWKLGVVFKPRENGSIYVAYNRSEQNPGTNLNLSLSETGTGADNINSDPQESVNYEIGTKWNFLDDKLATTFAVYRTEQKNVGVAADSITGDVVQTGEQVVTGAEFTVAGQITDNWAIFGGIGYANSENKNPAPTATNDGVELDWTPEWSGSVWTTYRFDFGLTIGGGLRYLDGSSTTRLSTGSTIPGTEEAWIFDALVAYEITKDLTVRLNVNNVFDDEYIAKVNNNGNRFNYGAPRSYVISADWKF